MPEAVPPAAPAAPTVTTATPASRTGMEAALHLLGGLSGTPAPAPALQAGSPVAQAPATETAPQKTPEHDPVARAAANQVRKERQLLDQQRALKAKEAELAAQAKQVEQRLADMEARLKAATEAETQRNARRQEYLRDPRLALQDTGISYEHLTQAILNDGAANPELLAKAMEERVQAVQEGTRKELEALKAQQAEERKRAEEAAQRAQQAEKEQALAMLKADISETVKAAPEEFELIALFGQEGLVLKAMEQHYQETGAELSPLEAAKRVEAYLVSESERVFGTKRFANRLKPKEEPKTTTAAGAAATPVPAAPTTLGNLPPAPTTPGRKGGAPDWDSALAALRGAKF